MTIKKKTKKKNHDLDQVKILGRSNFPVFGVIHSTLG